MPLNNPEYSNENRKTWNDWARVHFNEFEPRFVELQQGAVLLNQFERKMLSSYQHQRAVHLQCHLGVEVFSMLNMGFAHVDGVDFSEDAIALAATLARELNVDSKATFHCADVLAIPTELASRYDVAFSNTGSLCWLPSVTSWALNVAKCLRVGGCLILHDLHPILNSADLHARDGIRLRNDYLEQAVPYTSLQDRTHSSLPQSASYRTHEWSHGLAEIWSGLEAAGFRVKTFEEHPEVGWCAFEWLEPVGMGLWRAPNTFGRIPLSFSMVADFHGPKSSEVAYQVDRC